MVSKLVFVAWFLVAATLGIAGGFDVNHTLVTVNPPPGLTVTTTTTAYPAAALHLNGGQPAGTPSGNVSVTATLIGTTLNVSMSAPEDNVWINPDMEVAQRGTSFAAIATGAYSLDRLLYQNTSAAVHTVSQSSTVPTVAQAGRYVPYSALADCTTADASIAAGDLCIVSQRVEGYRFTRIAQGPFTLSFWVRGTKTGIYCVSFVNSGTDRSYVAEYTIYTTNTWEWKTITVPYTPSAGTWNYTTGIGLRVSFALNCGSTYQTTANAWQTGQYYGTSSQVNATDNTANDFHITGVLLTPGYTSPIFKARGFHRELELCLRYAYKIVPANRPEIGSGEVATPTVADATVQFPVPMRAAPTMSSSGTTSNFKIFAGGSLPSPSSD